MREITLSRGLKTIVDDDDYARLAQRKWSASHHGSRTYAVRSENQKTLRMHREILGAESGVLVDHINGDTLDNRRANLRLCSSTENVRNRRKGAGKTSSRFKGVCWDKWWGKWLVSIKVNDRLVYVGRYDDEVEAARAYNRAATKMHGEFARLNELSPQ